MINLIGVYKITNLINNKCYIGQSQNIEQRWKRHIATAFNENDNAYNYPLYCDIRFYGIDNFAFEVIELCDCADLLVRETF